LEERWSKVKKARNKEKERAVGLMVIEEDTDNDEAVENIKDVTDIELEKSKSIRSR
jgi:hypothetical protein